MADHPDLVAADIMSSLPYVGVSLPDVLHRGLTDFEAMGMPKAYNGSPAAATAAEGESVFATLSELLVGVMRDLARGAGGRDRPRPA